MTTKSLPMLHSLRRLPGSTVKAEDGDFGVLYNVYISEAEWMVSYFVVQTGGWLHDRRVLVSPEALHTPFWLEGSVYVELSRQQILNSPPIDAAKPFSRQQEALMNAYFGWPAQTFPGMANGQFAPDEPVSTLRSLRELLGYAVEGVDGEAGKVVDIIGEEPGWRTPFLVIDLGGILARKRFCTTRAVTAIDWGRRTIQVSISTQTIEQSPEPLSCEFPDPQFGTTVETYYRSNRHEEVSA